MTKLRNKILLVLLALCFVACMGLLVACGGDDDKKPGAKSVTYTVTVKADDVAVKGVKVTVKKGGVSFAPKTTGDDGKVEFSLAEDSGYTVELADLPENYEVPSSATLSFPSDRNLTVNLAEKFAYKVKLINLDGSAFTMEGVTVGICDTNNQCRNPVAIDANGLARIEATKEDYHIQILGLPVGYAYERDSKGYSMHRSDDGTYIEQGDDNTYNSLSATVYEQTVTIYPVNVIDFSKLTPLTDDEIANRYNDSNRTITGGKAYRIALDIPAGETAYYAFTAEYSGEYNLYAIGFNSATMGYKTNEWFQLGDIATSGNGMFNANGQIIETVKDDNYYINVTNKSTSAKWEGEFILATPLASKDTVTGATTVKAVVGDGVNAVIALAPTAGASYKLTVQGEGAIALASFDTAASYEFADGDYVQNAECKIRFTGDMVGGTKYFAVSVKATSYPANVTVKVEKIADLKDTVVTVTPSVTLTQFGEQTGKELVEIEMDGTSSKKIIYNDTDKYYHYGTADGPLVVVMLTKALPANRFAAEAPIIYLEPATNMQRAPYVFNVTTVTEGDDDYYTTSNTYKDYRVMLRGFVDYKVTAPTTPGGEYSYDIPADITVQSYYAKYVNSDGVYPLTKDLKEYLQYVVMDDMVPDNYVQWQIPMDAEYDDFWLFACYYYDTYVEPDVIVGEYNHVAIKATEDGMLSEENGDLNGDEYTLVINKRGTYVIKENGFFGAEVYEKGTWTKDGEDYTFTTSDGTVYTNVMFDAEEGFVTLMTAASTVWAFRNENSEVVDVIVGDYEFVRCYDSWLDEEIEVDGTAVTADSYKLTVNNDGTFMVYKQSGSRYDEVYNSIGEWSFKKGVYTFTVPGADYDLDWNPIDLVFTVDYNIGTGELKLIGSDTSEWEFKKDGEAFVGVYELVSFEETVQDYDFDARDYVSVTTEYAVGDTYTDYFGDEYTVTNDFVVFNVIGKTVHFSGYEVGTYNFVGTWTKTVGGKYTITGENANGPMECVVRFNKAANTWSFTVGEEYTGIASFVLRKKVDQSVDPIVGEYTNLVKMLLDGEEKTVEDGDILSDDYKLRVMPGGRFDIVEYGYPDYKMAVDEGKIGKWVKTDAGYAFTYYGYDADYNFGEVAYTVTVSEDLSEISLVNEANGSGYWFTKTAEDEGEADAIVGEYKFVIMYDSWGDPIKVGDVHYTGATIDEAFYNLIVFKTGRFVIESDVEDAIIGTWSKADDAYTFSQPGRPPVTYTVEFDATTGRIALDTDDYYSASWVFQKGGDAELTGVYVADSDDTAVMQVYSDNTYKFYVGNVLAATGEVVDGVDVYTFIVDEGTYTIFTNGYQGALYTEDGNTMMAMYEWGFKLSLKDGEEWTLLVSGRVIGGDEEHPEVEILESAETVSGVELEMVVEGENEEDMAVLIKATVSYTDGTDQEYSFDMTERL